MEILPGSSMYKLAYIQPQEKLGWAVPHSKFLSQVFQVRFWCCKKQIWSIHWVDWEDDLKNEVDLKNEDDIKNEDNHKNLNDLKRKTLSKKICPPPLKRILPAIFFDDLSPQQPQDNGYQTGNVGAKPEIELHMINIIYAALPMREQTEKMTFSCKDD